MLEVHSLSSDQALAFVSIEPVENEIKNRQYLRTVRGDTRMASLRESSAATRI